MISLGRGRGRVSSLPPLRRPGQPANSPDYILSMLALSESSDEVDLVPYVMGQVTAACSSPASSRDVVNIIHQMSINDWKFGKVGAEVLARLVQLDHNNSKDAVLDKFQSAFEGREMMGSGCGSELTNFVYYLGDFYSKAVLRIGATILVANTLVTCLRMVLDRRISRVTLFTEQILLNGHKLWQHAPDRLAQLMIQARKLLMGRPALDNAATICIALCIDLEANNFFSLPDHLISLYMASLPSNYPIIKKKVASLRKRVSCTCETGSPSQNNEENILNLSINRKWISTFK